MRRVRYYEHGAPEVLTVETADVPTPGPGQVRLRTQTIGANFVDTKIRSGAGSIFTRPLPGTLTGDVIGEVDALGPGVDRPLGQRVAALVADDAFADYVLADADWLAPVPDGLTAVAASLLPTIGPVALGILRTGQLAEGETVLIQSAAGGIGGAAVQLAKLIGAGTVIGTASTNEKLKHVRDLGADISIDYTAQDWPEQVAAAAPDGVNVVVDAVGGPTLLRSVDLLAPFGRAVTYGMASGEPTLIPQTSLFRMRAVLGYSLLAWRAGRTAQARAEIEEVTRYVIEGRLRADLQATLPLAEAVEAHRRLENRSTVGRILLVP
jgi:NADPH2:quinone reductase